MTKSIVIIGSGGMLGSTLLKKIAKDSEYHIYGITSQKQRLTKEYSEFNHVSIFSSVSEIPIEKIDVTINCSFPRHNKGKELATAFNFTENIIDQLAEKSCSHFINISSQSVYAQTGEDIQTEKSNVDPSNLYGMTKYAIERLVRLKAIQHNMRYVNVRLGSLVSPTFDQRMINRFCSKIVNHEPIIVDKGTPKVSYLYVEDAADALEILIEKIIKDKTVKELYNLANNDWMTIQTLVKVCITHGEKKGLKSSEMIFSNNISEYNNLVNSDLFYKDMNWKPTYSMKNLIEIIFDTKLKNKNII